MIFRRLLPRLGYVALLLTPLGVTAADNLVKAKPDGNINHMYLITADGYEVPAIAAFTTDGNGNIIPIGAGGGGVSNVFVTNFPAVQAVSQSGSWSVTASQGTSPWVVDGSGVIQPVSGTVTALQGSPPWSVSQSGVWTTGRTWSLSSGTDSVTAVISGTVPISGTVNQGSPNTLANGWPVEITDGTNLLGTPANPIRIDPTGTTIQPISGSVSVSNFPATVAVTQSTSPWVVSGTVTANQGTSPWVVGGTVAATQSGTWTTGRTWTLSSGTDSVSASVSNFPAVQPVSQSGSWTVTANAGTNLNTSALALDTTVSALQVSQGSTTSGEKGTLVLGAVTTGSPTYTTAQSNPLSLTTGGLLRVDASGATVPISGTITANQGTSPWVISGTVAATQSGAWTTGRTWTLSSGTDSISAAQSGTWTVQQGTPPWSVSQSGAWTVTQGTSPWVSNISQFGGSNVVTGTGASGAGIPRVTVSNDSNVLATQSGTWTVQQGTPPWSVVGNVASAASDSGNPVKTGGVFHSSTQTFSDGQRADTQLNAHGIPIIDSQATDVTGTFTTTGTTSAIDGSGYGSISFTVNVSAASGTTPTLDVQLQVSQDGTNDWVSVYDANRFTTTGSFQSSRFNLRARYYRFQYVIGGATPSFTFTVRTTLKTQNSPIIYSFNRFNDLVMTASNSFSSTVNLEGCSFWSATLTRGAGGAGVAIVAQFSNDGTNWVSSATSNNTSASSTTLVNNAEGNAINLTAMTKYARFTNTNNQAAATTMDIRWYCKE